jgi:multidrug efflux pump subunit AcrB
MLAVLHETINIMTLGGLALAVGILVDDAVEIENINRNLESGKEISRPFSMGPRRSQPALVSTLSVALCSSNVPAQWRCYLLCRSRRCSFAMRSYLLSRTVVPTMAKYLLHEHDDAAVARKESAATHSSAFREASSLALKSFAAYLRLLTLCLDYPAVFIVSCSCCQFAWVAGSVARSGLLPSVDSGQLRFVRARTGTRIEETAALCDHIDATIRKTCRRTKWSQSSITSLPYSG